MGLEESIGMIQCEKRFDPTLAIKRFKNHEHVEKILEHEHLSVLDIGCRVPIYLYVLYHDFNFRDLVGIEFNSEDAAVDELLKLNTSDKEKNSRTIYDVYRNEEYFCFDDADLKAGKKYLAEEDFRNVFRIYFKTTGLEYLSQLNNKVKYDYIILSDVLHLNKIDIRDMMFTRSIGALKNGGLLYVKVNHDQNPTAKQKGHYTFDEETFLKLFNTMEAIHTCKNLQDDGNIKSMVFFGYKK